MVLGPPIPPHASRISIQTFQVSNWLSYLLPDNIAKASILLLPLAKVLSRSPVSTFLWASVSIPPVYLAGLPFQPEVIALSCTYRCLGFLQWIAMLILSAPDFLLSFLFCMCTALKTIGPYSMMEAPSDLPKWKQCRITCRSVLVAVQSSISNGNSYFKIHL